MTIANLVAVSRLTEALSRAASLDDVYQASLDALEHSLGVSRSSILLFDDEGFMTFVASRGISDVALQIASETTPNVLVSDIGMPGDDGYSLIMKIRSGAIEPLRDVPAIALTAYARADDRERALASGFGYHLAKPVDPIVMVKTVAEAARPRN